MLPERQFEVKRTVSGAWREFGLASTTIINYRNEPFLTVQRFGTLYSAAVSGYYHRTRWPTEFDRQEGIDFITWAQTEFSNDYPQAMQQKPNATLQIEAAIPVNQLTPQLSLRQSLSELNLRSYSITLPCVLGSTSIRYGMASYGNPGYPSLGEYTCVEISSRFNLAEFISKMLLQMQLDEGIPKDLPVDDIKKTLTKVYQRYPKPELLTSTVISLPR